MEFILGCNYWASNAGIEMWRQFEPNTIENDLKILSAHGVKYLRVFPLWRDFQPVKPNFAAGGKLSEYVMESGKKPQNDYFLDENMMERFSKFLDICDTYNIRIIIGLITGWMSGGLFVPTALYGKDVLTDPTAIYLEQLFIKGFVNAFKDRNTVYAWDLGNECNCAGVVNTPFEAANWTAAISNAIRAADNSRPVISGMHGLTLDGNWTIDTQAQFTDMLTTHPYPLWCRHTTIDETLSLRTTMHATAESKWYADIGGKPCLAEEIGTMGPMVCSNEKAADFLRLNLFSLWANGATGVMWWCNHDQNLLETFPYTVNMVERELGLIDNQNTPKPALYEIKRFADFLKNNNINLSAAQENGVCLLTKGQDHWAVAYMTYVLSKGCGLNLKFADALGGSLPESNLYLMPSVNGITVMHKETFDELIKRVCDGADLYISAGSVHLEGFEKLVGLKVIDSYICGQSNAAVIDGEEIPIYRPTVRKYKLTTAKVIASDKDGNPFITVNRYGKGRIFFVDAPIEACLTGTHNAFNQNTEKIYGTIFKEHINSLPVKTDAKDVALTYHPDKDGGYIVAINHSSEEKTLNVDLSESLKIEKVIYGDSEKIKPYDACVLKLKQQ